MTAPTSNVLLIESDRKEVELYSDLIREVADCRVDVMSRIGGRFDGLPPSQYNLVVIDTQTVGDRHAKAPTDGLALLERIRRTSPETSVIIVASDARVEEAVAAIRLGAEDYFKKPFNPEMFKLAIKRGLDRKLVFGENLGASGYLHLLTSCQMISATLEQDKVFEIVKSFFLQELSCKYSEIYSVHNGELVRVNAQSADSHPDQAMIEVLDIAIHATNPCQKMLEAKEMYRFVERGQLTPGLFVFRFTCASEGDFFCVSLSPRMPSDMDTFDNRLHLLNRQLEVTGNNISQYMGVQHLVYVDDATGLYNTRYMSDVLDREIARAEAVKSSFAVLFVDVDHFKQVNDTHGHLVGTKLLNELGRQLRAYVRESDTVFRYGGDEFVAVLAPCDLATAKMVAERIRKSTERREFIDQLELKITVSIGIALFPDHAKSKKGIIEMADRAMYSAKKRSRNRVEILPFSDKVASRKIGGAS